jgi:molybdopterin-guanine dinucleotide biosynthesis protein MobB
MDNAGRYDAAIDYPIPLIGFAAYSGTGKTTLLLKLLPLLKASDLRVAVVKHAHHSFDMDYPGKDSYRLRAAGADEMLVAAKCRIGWIRECNEQRDEPSLREALAVLDPSRLDLVLVEGFKAEAFPKIELHRPALGRPLLFPQDQNIIAIATDAGRLAQDPGDLPRLSINQPTEIAAFVLEFIGRGERLRSPLAG